MAHKQRKLQLHLGSDRVQMQVQGLMRTKLLIWSKKSGKKISARVALNQFLAPLRARGLALRDLCGPSCPEVSSQPRAELWPNKESHMQLEPDGSKMINSCLQVSGRPW